jgi:hypothetical protein
MLADEDFCRCGKSLKLIRNCPTMACAGTKTQSLSACQRVYIPESGVTSNGSCRRLTTKGTVRGLATSAHSLMKSRSQPEDSRTRVRFPPPPQ